MTLCGHPAGSRLYSPYNLCKHWRNMEPLIRESLPATVDDKLRQAIEFGTTISSHPTVSLFASIYGSKLSNPAGRSYYLYGRPRPTKTSYSDRTKTALNSYRIFETLDNLRRSRARRDHLNPTIVVQPRNRLRRPRGLDHPQ